MDKKKKATDNKLVRNYGVKIKNVDEVNHELTAIVSTDDMDRYGDIVVQEGIDLKNFKNNPVIPWGHDYDQPPVAKAIETEITSAGLMMRLKFAVEQYPFAATIFKLYAAGFLRAFSIGFIPKEFEDKQTEEGQWIRTYVTSELLEVSAVTIPANPSALALAMTKGVIDKKELGAITGDTVDAPEDMAELKAENTELKEKLETSKKNAEMIGEYRNFFKRISDVLESKRTDDELASIDLAFKHLVSVMKQIPIPNPEPNAKGTPKARTAVSKDKNITSMLKNYLIS